MFFPVSRDVFFVGVFGASGERLGVLGALRGTWGACWGRSGGLGSPWGRQMSFRRLESKKMILEAWSENTEF